MDIEIELTQGKTSHVSEEDEALTCLKWYAYKARKTFYAVRSTNPGTVRLHREVMERMLGRPLLKSEHVDHIDGNGLNNRRSNLRLATKSQNGANSRRYSNNASGFIGVSFHRAAQKWRPRIRVDGKNKHLGLFDVLEEAARARDLSAVKFHKEFAKLNFPDLLPDYLDQLQKKPR